MISQELINIFIDSLIKMGVTDTSRQDFFVNCVADGKINIKTINTIVALQSTSLRQNDKLAILISIMEGKVKEKYVRELISYNDIKGLKDVIDFYVITKKTEFYNKFVAPKIDVMQEVAKAIMGGGASQEAGGLTPIQQLIPFGFNNDLITILNTALEENRIRMDDIKYIIQTIEDPKIPIDAEGMQKLVSTLGNPTVNMDETLGIMMQGLTDGTLASEEIEGLVDCVKSGKIDDVFGFVYELSKEQRAEKIMELLMG